MIPIMMNTNPLTNLYNRLKLCCITFLKGVYIHVQMSELMMYVNASQFSMYFCIIYNFFSLYIPIYQSKQYSALWFIQSVYKASLLSHSWNMGFSWFLWIKLLMKNCEVMTSTHSFAYIFILTVHKMFCWKLQNSKFSYLPNFSIWFT